MGFSGGISFGIMHAMSSFSGIAKKYFNFHLGEYSDEELKKARSEEDRIAVCEKRLSAGWFTYSLIEMKQRFQI